MNAEQITLLRNELKIGYWMGIHCLDWHGGLRSGLYQVGIRLTANDPVGPTVIDRAVIEAEGLLEQEKRTGNHPTICDLSILVAQLDILQRSTT